MSLINPCGIKPICALQTPQVYMEQQCTQVPYPCIKNFKPSTCYKSVFCVSVPKTRMVDNQDCINKHNIYNACMNSLSGDGGSSIDTGYTEIPPIDNSTTQGTLVSPNSSPKNSETQRLTDVEKAELKKKVINYTVIGIVILLAVWLLYWLYKKYFA